MCNYVQSSSSTYFLVANWSGHNALVDYAGSVTINLWINSSSDILVFIFLFIL